MALSEKILPLESFAPGAKKDLSLIRSLLAFLLLMNDELHRNPLGKVTKVLLKKLFEKTK